jgi:hypothetical protein
VRRYKVTPETDGSGTGGSAYGGRADADEVIQGNGVIVNSGNLPLTTVSQKPPQLLYEADSAPKRKYPKIAHCLQQCGDLFRHPDAGSGLILIEGKDHSRQRTIVTGSDLSACICDRVEVAVVSAGKSKGHRIPSTDLAEMLKTEIFLKCFEPLDRVIQDPLYLPKWQLTVPGYNNGGPGQRFYFNGNTVPVFDEPETIHRFLNAMSFKSNSVRTNTVAAALTVMLRNHWPGRKPMFPVTANRSHAGKGTIVAFITGNCVSEQVTYEGTDWAFHKAVVTAFQQRPDLGLLNIDNIRLDQKGEVIRSSFLERILHEAEPLLSSPGTKVSLRVHNHFVVAATVNQGRFSEDLVNRSVAIRLEATGDLSKRQSPLGDPKGDFLPRYRDQIDGELRGMIEQWIAGGRPLDLKASHPSYPEWAQTIGGILMVAGFTDFLANTVERRSEDDPIRRGLALLGCDCPDEWLSPANWAALIAKLGLTPVLIHPADRDTPDGRARGTGVVLSNHSGENFTIETDDEVITLILEKKRARFEGEPQTRYRFVVSERSLIPVDAEM